MSSTGRDIPEGPRIAQKVQEAEASMPYLFYMLANDGGLDEKNEPVWVLWQAFRSCDKAEQLVDDLTSEFGDRARGKAGVIAARKDFLDWAATQPSEITLNVWATLGAWNQADGTFPVQHYDNISTIDIEEAKKAHPDLSEAIAPGMDTYASLNIRPNLIPFWCPSKDGQSLLRYDTQQQAWRMQLGAYDKKRSLPGVPNFSGFPGWPELKMDRDAAKAFSDANPTRRVHITFTVDMDKTPVNHSSGYVVNLVAHMKSASITDPAGKVLSTRTY